MSIPMGVAKALAVVAAMGAASFLYAGLERPWLLRWGATDAEIAASLPGDAHVREAEVVSTRAVTIRAPIDRVWPWVAQLGQDRAGFYSYELLEDLVGGEMPHATSLLPDRQSWKTGDALWMYPPEKLAGAGNAPLLLHAPERHLVFTTRQIGLPATEPPGGTWGFYLTSRGTQATRLVVRGRGPRVVGGWARVFHYGAFEAAHFAMERRMMLNIAALAEGRRTWRAWEVASVALWTVTVGVMVVALARVLRRRRWLRPLAVGTAAMLVFQLLTLVQPDPWVGAVVVAALLLALRDTAAGRSQAAPEPARRAAAQPA